MPDYKATAAELEKLVQTLDVSKKELQDIATRGETGKRTDEKLKAVEEALTQVREIVRKTELTGAERQRKIAQLESELELLETINSTSPDSQERLKAQRDISRCSAALGAYKVASVLRVEELLDENRDELKAILAEAARDIAARQNLQRVLKGVEVVLRTTVFTAALMKELAAGRA
jgi:chromosome segregation ATPase